MKTMQMTDRRTFIGGAGGFALAALGGGCLTATDVPKAAMPRDTVWGALLHLGGNMWGDWTPDGVYPKSRAEELEMLRTGKLTLAGPSRLDWVRDYMSVDWKVWRGETDLMRKEGLNAIFIDIGEAYAFPSHPELWVAGSLKPDELRAELARLRAQGLEPIPKLNFSAGHDQWLREYHYMTSTPKYHAVVADVIRDVCEVFDRSRYFHIGYDEEVYACVKHREMVVLRQGDLWWKDFLRCVREVERHGMRAMMWSDKICCGREEYLKRMPKSVLQVPWYYGTDFSEENTKWRPQYEKNLTWDVQKNLAASIVELTEAGYDVMPCTSNWSSPEASEAMLDFCSRRLDPKRVKGYLTAPWKMSVEEDDAKNRAGISQFAEAKRRHFA